MKFYLLIHILFCLIILSFIFKAQNQIVADLSQENVAISTAFLVAKILLF